MNAPAPDWVASHSESRAALRERADCTVRATAAVLDIPYAAAHAKLAALGRQDRGRFRFRADAAATLGLALRPDLCARRVGTILPQLATGRFVVRVRRHVFAVVNGVAHDLTAPRLHQIVEMVYENAEVSHD